MAKVYAVIMAGGAGTRFWPASRSLRPKQLLPLGGTDEPLLAATVRRLAPLVRPENVIVVTGDRIGPATAEVLPGVSAEHILFEPVARNTAPCVAWAASVVARTDPDAIVAVLPADHFITDEPAFREVLQLAIASAETGKLTTIGIVPTRPETGYGYIEVGAELGGGANEVVRFTEKPDRVRAEEFFAGKRHLWNAGMFFFRARHMMALFGEHEPQIAAGIALIDAAARTGNESEVLKSVFPTLPSISIDNAIAEKAGNLAVVRGDFGWNDVGSWQSAYELADKDEAGNALPEGAIAIDATNNLVRSLGSSGKAIAIVGVSDLVVVDTEDALLILPRERAQDVRLVVEALKTAQRTKLL